MKSYYSAHSVKEQANAVANESVCLYPNPTSTGFATGIKDPAQVEVFTANGTAVKSQTIDDNEQVSVAGLAKGLYFVTIKTSTMVVTRTLVVE